MNYLNIYNSIIDRAKTRNLPGYTEKHHVVPKSIGGSDDKSNIVELTAKEHFVCHLLLTKVYARGTPEYYKMIKAFVMMSVCSKNQNRHNSATFARVREDFSKAQRILQSGNHNSNHGTMWIHSIELRTSKKIPKDAEVPLGWQKGRVINFDKIDIAKKKEAEKIKKHEEYLIRVRDIMHYYRDNDISMRELSKQFNVGHNVYKTFEKYYPEEYKAIVSKKRGNSNVTKGRYLES